jgi:serine/threonine protein kinase
MERKAKRNYAGHTRQASNAKGNHPSRNRGNWHKCGLDKRIESSRENLMEPLSKTPQVGSVITIKEFAGEKYVVGSFRSGGMGEVYQLIPIKIVGPALALKTYKPSADRDDFIREAEIWISLGNHPHIAPALVYVDWQSKPGILSLWYERSLEGSDAGSWPTSKLIDFTARLIDGLQHARTVGQVIHQDIKPANILLDENDRPRVTDFGMARFSPIQRRVIGDISEINPSMRHSIAIGPIGGTLPYMAPELILGRREPSVQTDIFSLGVTLYEVLTGEHPYCGRETNFRWQPALRHPPLTRLKQIRGGECAPLVALIAAALQLDVLRRPASYESLAAIFGIQLSEPHAVNGGGVDNVVTKVAFLRESGQAQEALAILQRALRTRPTNPQLLNSYAILLLSLNRKQDAYSAWDGAVESLKFTKGRHERSEYPDPAVNLAERMIDERRFQKADDLYTLVNDWCRDAHYLLLNYMEFGWWHLYHQRFEEAWQHITVCSRSKAFNERSLWCVTLAAWLSGNFEEKLDTLANAYLRLPRIGVNSAVLACIVATYCRASVRGKLIALAYPDHQVQLTDMAMQIGLRPADFRQALPESAVRIVIRSVDAMVTGGRNNGLI